MSTTALFGIVLPCVLSILLWTIYLYGTNRMTIIGWISLLIAAFCPVINVASLIIVIYLLCYALYVGDIDDTTKCGKVIKFFT